jgi:tetratricopeptide (TPR) repeat protein
MSRTPQDVVSLYLRAQNLEQVHRLEEAVALYEQAVAAGFDSAGPYDRLIAIYRGRERHGDVMRIAGAALEHVRTFDDKRASYELLLKESREALDRQPDPRGPDF